MSIRHGTYLLELGHLMSLEAWLSLILAIAVLVLAGHVWMMAVRLKFQSAIITNLECAIGVLGAQQSSPELMEQQLGQLAEAISNVDNWPSAAQQQLAHKRAVLLSARAVLGIHDGEVEKLTWMVRDYALEEAMYGNLTPRLERSTELLGVAREQQALARTLVDAAVAEVARLEQAAQQTD